MKIDYRSGDMFKGGHKYLAHGCNAQGVMGSGVARIVNDKYHYAYKTYRHKFDSQGLNLGEVVRASISHRDSDKPTIFNCITQNRYGNDGQRYVNYGAVQMCMVCLNDYFRVHDCMSEVAMPMIGAGLGMGDWGIIADIIERKSEYFQPVVYDFTP